MPSSLPPRSHPPEPIEQVVYVAEHSPHGKLAVSRNCALQLFHCFQDYLCSWIGAATLSRSANGWLPCFSRQFGCFHTVGGSKCEPTRDQCSCSPAIQLILGYGTTAPG